MATLNFNANEVEPVDDFSPIPAGKYVAMVTESQMKPNRDGTGEYLEMTFQVLEGEYRGRLLWARLSLNHPKEITTKIARHQLAQICKAVGVSTPRDSAELHNVPMVVTVKLKKRKDNGELTNELGAFAAQQSTAPTAAPRTSTAPWRR